MNLSLFCSLFLLHHGFSLFWFQQPERMKVRLGLYRIVVCSGWYQGTRYRTLMMDAGNDGMNDDDDDDEMTMDDAVDRYVRSMSAFMWFWHLPIFSTSVLTLFFGTRKSHFL